MPSGVHFVLAFTLYPIAISSLEYSCVFPLQNPCHVATIQLKQIKYTCNDVFVFWQIQIRVLLFLDISCVICRLFCSKQTKHAEARLLILRLCFPSRQTYFVVVLMCCFSSLAASNYAQFRMFWSNSKQERIAKQHNNNVIDAVSGFVVFLFRIFIVLPPLINVDSRDMHWPENILVPLLCIWCTDKNASWIIECWCCSFYHSHQFFLSVEGTRFICKHLVCAIEPQNSNRELCKRKNTQEYAFHAFLMRKNHELCAGVMQRSLSVYC